jgi:glycosyltransferase involved in cell wall biosynthesis
MRFRGCRSPALPTLTHREKPTLLLLTSSFPCSPTDETCGYIRDFARSLAADFSVTVLAPPDRSAVQWPPDAFTLIRSGSVVPASLDPFGAGSDFNHLASRSPITKLFSVVSLVCFLARALTLALKCDAVCSHWILPSGLVGALINRLLGKPHVVVEHSGALHLLARMRCGKQIARFVIGGADRVVTVSSDLKRKLSALYPNAGKKIEIIPMGVSVPSGICEASLKPSPRVILFIGRLTEIKGLDVLLRAMRGLEDLSLMVAGDGERRDEFEALARSLPVKARFIGSINSSTRDHLLSICDIVVIPSRVLADGRTEGMPVVCLEAMAAGRVVIASRVGGLAEVIVDGENGLLFEQSDRRMLREKLRLALTDDSLRQKISENARRSAAAYDWARIGSRYSEVLKEALRENDAIGSRRIEAGSIGG